MKYKIGDKVKVRTDLIVDGVYGGQSFMSGMKLFAGKIYTIRKIDSDRKYYMFQEIGWVWTDEMIEGPVKTPFTKSDLKTGMVVEYRNGDRRIVFRNYQGTGKDLLIGDRWASLNDYPEDLADDSDGDRNYDIMKVYNAKDFCATLRLLDKKCCDYKVVWERKEIKEVTLEQIAEKFGVPVDQLRIKE